MSRYLAIKNSEVNVYISSTKMLATAVQSRSLGMRPRQPGTVAVLCIAADSSSFD